MIFPVTYNFEEFKYRYVAHQVRYDHITDKRTDLNNRHGILDKYTKSVIYRGLGSDTQRLAKELNDDDDLYLVQIYVYLKFS